MMLGVPLGITLSGSAVRGSSTSCSMWSPGSVALQVVLQQGSAPNPLAFYAARDYKPEELASATARLFLGVRIECAQCHDHPFTSWKRSDYWSMASFFSKVQAGGKKVGLEKEATYDLVLNDAHVNASANDTFEKSGVAKNAREEKIRARDAKIKQDAENAKMAKLYRKEVLGEQEQPGFISLGEIKAAPAPTVKAEVVQSIEETVSAD